MPARPPSSSIRPRRSAAFRSQVSADTIHGPLTACTTHKSSPNASLVGARNSPVPSPDMNTARRRQAISFTLLPPRSPVLTTPSAALPHTRGISIRRSFSPLLRSRLHPGSGRKCSGANTQRKGPTRCTELSPLPRIHLGRSAQLSTGCCSSSAAVGLCAGSCGRTQQGEKQHAAVSEVS